jgi:hypothetical protein
VSFFQKSVDSESEEQTQTHKKRKLKLIKLTGEEKNQGRSSQ